MEEKSRELDKWRQSFADDQKNISRDKIQRLQKLDSQTNSIGSKITELANSIEAKMTTNQTAMQEMLNDQHQWQQNCHNFAQAGLKQGLKDQGPDSKCQKKGTKEVIQAEVMDEVYAPAEIEMPKPLN
eukprot:9299693-Ditylum_brightwellii.AAC.1